MAKKLYIFGIGGTGSRVIKALIMLLASGCKLENEFDTVVPIIIDPDTGNGDLNRTKEILKLYQEIRKNIDSPADFFSQEVKTVDNLVTNPDGINGDGFQFLLNGTAGTTFRDFIHYSNLSPVDKLFIDTLYSQKNLDSDLDVGFKGNPNMGSIVLNQFTSSKDFQKFGQSFNPGDGIFIINSIFGGTGAAGFPLLLKSLRNGANIPNSAQISEAPTGCVTYLPYFKLNKGEIDSDTFLEKAKSAIDYYNRTIINQSQLESLYFLGDVSSTSIYDNHAGQQSQKNDAHFLELAGALAIIDFCSNAPNLIHGQTKIKEFGIENDTSPLTFDSLNTSNSNQIKSHLQKFRFFTEYLNKGLPRALDISRWTKKRTQLTKQYFESREYKNEIENFISQFNNWTQELESNSPSFSPFNSIIKLNDKGKQLFKSLDTLNCLEIDKTPISESKKHSQLIKLFGSTTQKVIEKQKL
jgi:hypothetical protein